VTDYYTKRHKGYAFIEYKDASSASKAVEDKTHPQFQNQILNVEMAQGHSLKRKRWDNRLDR